MNNVLRNSRHIADQCDEISTRARLPVCLSPVFKTYEWPSWATVGLGTSCSARIPVLSSDIRFVKMFLRVALLRMFSFRQEEGPLSVSRKVCNRKPQFKCHCVLCLAVLLITFPWEYSWYGLFLMSIRFSTCLHRPIFVAFLPKYPQSVSSPNCGAATPSSSLVVWGRGGVQERGGLCPLYCTSPSRQVRGQEVAGSEDISLPRCVVWVHLRCNISEPPPSIATPSNAVSFSRASSRA